MNIKSNATLTSIITTLVVIISILIILQFSAYGLLISVVVFLFAVGELAIMYFMRRTVLYRNQNIFANISIALIGTILITAIVDLKIGTYVMPGWTSVLGLLLFFSANYLLITSLIAVPRHCKEEYGEDRETEKSTLGIHGAYDVVRHPVNLAGFLLAFSIPLMLGSAFAFIASFVTAIFIIIHAVTIENYRFEKYTWYYDYTKKVPYMMIPVIW